MSRVSMEFRLTSEVVGLMRSFCARVSHLSHPMPASDILPHPRHSRVFHHPPHPSHPPGSTYQAAYGRFGDVARLNTAKVF
jgi:hypothetical protein